MILILWSTRLHAAVEETFDLLQTRTATYTNVTVTKKTDEWIFILHSTGMVNVKVADLSAEVRAQLGYGKESQAKQSSGKFSPHFLSANQIEKIKNIEESLQKNSSEQVSRIAHDPTLLLITAALFSLFYLFFANCCRLICRKTHNAAGVLIWFPFLQLIPLFRAANMSRMWVLAFLIPLAPIPFLRSINPSHLLFVTAAVAFVPLVASIVWSVKIVKARGKNGWLALFLLLPITNLLSFLYLAFSSEATAEVKTTYKSMALETA